jgi:hypothetical protein
MSDRVYTTQQLLASVKSVAELRSESDRPNGERRREAERIGKIVELIEKTNPAYELIQRDSETIGMAAERWARESQRPAWMSERAEFHRQAPQRSQGRGMSR